MIRFLQFVLMLFTLSLSAQEPSIIHFSEKEGLPDRTIFNILEDKEGVLWLATNSGLYSFNGSKFTKYKHPTQDGSSVFGIQFDEKGCLWYTTITSKFYYLENNKVAFFDDYSDVFGSRFSMFKVVNGHVFISFNCTIEKSKETYIDFNAVAKGYAVDVVSEFLSNNRSENYLVEIGREIRVKGKTLTKSQNGK